jgi:hypothetical protein
VQLYCTRWTRDEDDHCRWNIVQQFLFDFDQVGFRFVDDACLRHLGPHIYRLPLQLQRHSYFLEVSTNSVLAIALLVCVRPDTANLDKP